LCSRSRTPHPTKGGSMRFDCNLLSLPKKTSWQASSPYYGPPKKGNCTWLW